MSDFWLGIAPEHRIPLAAALFAPLLLWQLRRALAGHGRVMQAEPAARWAVQLLAPVAVYHALLNPLALAGAIAAGWVAVRAAAGRRWRLRAALVAGALLGFAIVDTDQAAMAVALLELAVLALAAPRTVNVAVTVVFGAVTWIGGFVRHDHEGIDRLQAGTIQRGSPVTVAGIDGPALAERTRQATLRYRDPAAARAAGYAPAGRPEGLQVHFDNKRNQADGRTLDPEAPEQLVYAMRDGRALLLGVVYRMPAAGRRGPALPGSSARWHAHDICVGLLPPGFGIVSPFGGCPGLTVAVTAAEMIHVWVVDPPGGPYAEQLSDKWVAARLYGSG
ncbi:hypothetical protein [Dactylosporangium darangshiense]|uniref:Uncharacterized protein n=1 Tax=Dactylosporangium darangshiense TaxID=579108 RepID=A0ABP8DBK5_9ACTN